MSVGSHRVHDLPIELDTGRVLRVRNKIHYRLAHWPIWIWVFFIAPGPLTFDLFNRGFDARMALWLGVVMLATGIAGLRGRLPGVEPAPYIIRFTEDKPNPLYRRICYTFAWSAAVTFAALTIAGTIWLLGLLGRLPRVKASTKGEGHERRYFYGTVWAVCLAQPALWIGWKALPHARWADAVKLTIFCAVLGWVGAG
jgi:hypothetical protein